MLNGVRVTVIVTENEKRAIPREKEKKNKNDKRKKKKTHRDMNKISSKHVQYNMN